MRKHFGVEQRLEQLSILAEAASEEKHVGKAVAEFFLVLRVPILGVDPSQAPRVRCSIEAAAKKAV